MYGSTQVEPNLLGSKSDIYTVYAWSKICPCVPPRTPVALKKFIIMKVRKLKSSGREEVR